VGRAETVENLCSRNKRCIQTINLRNFYNYENFTFRIVDITFLSADIVMVVTVRAGIFFVSVESAICASHFKLQDSRLLRCTAVLSDGCIYVGDMRGIALHFNRLAKGWNISADIT